MRLSIEKVKERQEDQLLNNEEYGLLNQVVDSQRISTRTGPPTPDDFDDLLVKVWKQPSFFLAHPLAVAAFGRECTQRGVPPVAVNLYGAQFITWRGVPLVPSDKVAVDAKGKTNILLVRTGLEKQGVTGLFQPGLPGEVNPSLSVRFMGINQKAQAQYLIRCTAARPYTPTTRSLCSKVSTSTTTMTTPEAQGPFTRSSSPTSPTSCSRR